MIASIQDKPMSAHYKILRFPTAVALLVSFFILLSGCSQGAAGNKKDAVAYVNNEPILASELKREIALRARQDPMFKVTPETEDEQLDTIINRKLIIQEAMEKGLAREERFVNTIKTFWEQTLIRDFIDYKKREFQNYLFVTDDDVKRYYVNLSKRVAFKILKSKNKNSIDALYNKFLKDKDIDASGWQTFGPVGYEDITSNVLLEAFEMPQGEVKEFDDGAGHYLVMVVSVETVEIEPLENLKPGIEKRILAMKERRLFEDWLKEKRKASKIEVIRR